MLLGVGLGLAFRRFPEPAMVPHGSLARGSQAENPTI